MNSKYTPNKVATSIVNKLRSLKGLVGTVALFGAAFLAAIAINAFIFQPYEVDGSSMEPTLQNGDRLIVFKLGRTWERITGGEFIPKRGEIVVFNKSNFDTTHLIKRVIGLPGERVVVEDSTITVYNDDNPGGFNPDPSFDVDFLPTNGSLDVRVEDGEIFVVGDNRVPGASLDSRSSLGNVPVSDIVGTLTLRIFPINSFDKF